MTRTTKHRPAASRRAGRARPAGAVFLFFVLMMLGLPVRAANPTNSIEFSKMLPARGSAQWEQDRQSSQQRQELYRRRVFVPEAMRPFVPRAPSAKLINGAAPLPRAAPARMAGSFVDLIFFTSILVLAGILVARRFAPYLLVDFGRRYNPWAVSAAENGSPDYVRTEEKPFGDFLAALRAGPVRTTDGEAPENGGRQAQFFARARTRLVNQRKLLQDIRRDGNDAATKKSLVDLYFEFGGLKEEAGFPELLPIWWMASALEGLLKEHVGKIRNTTPSTLRTIAGGLDLLDQLCEPGRRLENLTGRPFKFLVVDDELVSRHALSVSLKKAFSEPDLAVDGPGALNYTSRQAYDVIFLDVQMPGMDGFELCEKIHASPPNQATPVVFVTNHSDFDARARSALAGGHDLMGKPFLIFEITVKALTLALQNRLLDRAGVPVAAAEPASPVPPPAVAVRAGTPDAGVLPDGRQPAAKTPPVTDELTGAFLSRLRPHLAPLRDICKAAQDATDAAIRQSLLTDGFLRINGFTGNGSGIRHPAYQLGSALEGLVRKLLQDATRSTPSALATVATALDLLADLCAAGPRNDLAIKPPIRLLVVDDDPVARRALTGALQTVFEKPDNAEDGEAAFARSRGERFDVIFLDLQMPGLGGFDTCAKIREAGCNRDTPVVFVTAYGDNQARAETMRAGGNDLVSKPFLTAEINVKALTFALRRRLQPAPDGALRN